MRSRRAHRDRSAAYATGAVTVFAVALALVSAMAPEPLAEEATPATLAEVLEARPEAEKELRFADERRRAAMRDAAVSFGMQSGLVRRDFELGRILERYARQLDRVYRFDRLLIANEGFTVAPPVVVETTQAFRLGAGAGARRARAGCCASRSRRGW